MAKESVVGFGENTTTEFDDILRQLIERRGHLITYGGWNGGYFHSLEKGYYHPANKELNKAESFVATLGKSVLEKTGSWNSVDLGSMAGFSDVLLASQVFASEIESGQVKMLATNYEHDFQILRLLDQARKNLVIYGSYDKWQECMKFAKKGVETGLLLTNRPILETEWHIDFLEQNHKYVEYVSGFNAEHVGSLRTLLPSITKIMFLHERMGGFNNSGNLSVTMELVMNNMDPDYGVIMTTTKLEGLVLPFESVDIGIADYRVYAAKGAKDLIKRMV